MKFTSLALTLGLAALTSATSQAVVYSSYAKHTSTKHEGQPTLSFEDAKLVLAHRLGLSRYYSLGDASAPTLALLNREHGAQALFSDSTSVRRLMVIVEALESPQVIQKHAPQFRVSVPADASLEALVDEFLDRDQLRRYTSSSCDATGEHGSLVRGGFSNDNPLGFCAVNTNDLGIVRGTPSLALQAAYKKGAPLSQTDASTAIFRVAIKGEKGNKESVAALKQLDTILSDIMSTDGQDSTIVLVPRAPSSSSHNARHKRGESRAPVEARTSKPSASSPKPAAKDGPPKTTLPSCWANEAACKAQTRNCTGHGACMKKYTERVSSDEEGPECWACQCVNTVMKLDGGATKTTFWGGPACQKKDISVPFFLFAGFSVAALALVSWGIGMLFSMGQQDLPSVLGAGVAPVTRK